MILRQIGFDIRTWWRNGEQLLLMLALPVGALLVGPNLVDRMDLTMQQLADGVVNVAYVATAFTGQAILTAFDRRSNALLVIGAGPIGRRGFVVARTGAVLIGCVGQGVVLTAVSVVCGYDGYTTGIHALVALIGVPAFVASGLLLAGLLRAEIVLGLANLIFVLSAMFGGAFNDVRWTPLGAVRACFTPNLSPGGLIVPLTALAVWTAVASITTMRTFRWVD